VGVHGFEPWTGRV